ncbi:hypothetical protein AAVH_26105 [Aphelenchoides avenae]|nr:hypothetical protein AAVH_26105 [Aphelenchus avenae]
MEAQCVNGPRILKPLLELKTVSKPADLQDMLNNRTFEVVAVFTETKPKIHVVIRHKYPFELEPAPPEVPQKKAKKDRDAQKAREEFKEFIEITLPANDPPNLPPTDAFPPEQKTEVALAKKR